MCHVISFYTDLEYVELHPDIILVGKLPATATILQTLTVKTRPTIKCSAACLNLLEGCFSFSVTADASFGKNKNK